MLVINHSLMKEELMSTFIKRTYQYRGEDFIVSNKANLAQLRGLRARCGSFFGGYLARDEETKDVAHIRLKYNIHAGGEIYRVSLPPITEPRGWDTTDVLSNIIYYKKGGWSHFTLEPNEESIWLSPKALELHNNMVELVKKTQREYVQIEDILSGYNMERG